MESSKNGILIFLLLVLIILVAGMSIFGYFYLSKNSNNDAVIIMNNAVPQEPDRWEYTFINGTVIGRTSNNGTAALIERANELGEEGW
ncbi:MAG: hypothetical protein LBC80_01270, partial [Treponema sp.]|nr:hypothetical protein [Treponema sp.]